MRAAPGEDAPAIALRRWAGPCAPGIRHQLLGARAVATRRPQRAGELEAHHGELLGTLM
jgi:hypothetical protein